MYIAVILENFSQAQEDVQQVIRLRVIFELEIECFILL